MNLVVTLGDRGFVVTAEEIADGSCNAVLQARLAELMEPVKSPAIKFQEILDAYLRKDEALGFLEDMAERGLKVEAVQ